LGQEIQGGGAGYQDGLALENVLIFLESNHTEFMQAKAGKKKGSLKEPFAVFINGIAFDTALHG
jgi:hypothetical protein